MKHVMRYFLLAASLLFFGGYTAFAGEGFDYNGFDYNRADFQETINMLAMEGHGSHAVESCNIKQLYYKEVADMMTKGKTKDQILAYYVNELGEQALQAPPKKGFNLALWTVPFLVLLIGSILVYVSVRKWLQRRELNAKEAQISPDLNIDVSDILHSVIDEERKKYM